MAVTRMRLAADLPNLRVQRCRAEKSVFAGLTNEHRYWLAFVGGT